MTDKPGHGATAFEMDEVYEITRTWTVADEEAPGNRERFSPCEWFL